MEFLKKNLLSIICIIAIIALFLPFISVTVDVWDDVWDYEETTHISGFDAAKEGFLGYILFLAPILLIAMNYIKALEKYRGILSIATPAFSMLILIIVCFQAKSYGAGDVDTEFLDVAWNLGIGPFIAGLSYVAAGIVGAKTYAPEILEKYKFSDIKSLGKNFTTAVNSSNTNKNTSTPSDELKKYKELLDSGVITQEEFDEKKKQLLNL